jgi:hypothetical protein
LLSAKQSVAQIGEVPQTAPRSVVKAGGALRI